MIPGLAGIAGFVGESAGPELTRRYLRVRITAPIHPSAAVYAVSELTCHETVGGSDVLAGSGATITATSTTGTNTTAKLVDADTSTFWASTGTGTQDLVIDWGAGAGKNICEIGLRGRNDSSWQQSPGTVAVAYSADNSTYTTDWSIPFITMQLDLGGLPFTLQKFRRTSLFPATSPNHRIWGVRWNACQSGTLPEINKIEMHATVGGSTINTGGTPLACIFFNTGNFPSWAFTGTDFAMVDLSHGVIAYDFGEGNEKVKPAEITLKASSIPNRAPTDFDLVYMDGLGGTVNVQQNFTSPATWTGGLTRTFTVT